MTETLKKPIVSLLQKFSTAEGEKHLKIASLWEKVLGGLSCEAKILQIKNQILFVGVKNNLTAQELRVRFQRIFLEQYEKEFGEKLKDIRFLLTH